ncbi:hypothetical protein RA20_20890 [Leisingera sp. ANG-Vp]|nr:hypothetical protein RA20_20890 [Leisingera sp. ANG-Vp]
MQGFDFCDVEPVAVVSISVPMDQMPKELIYWSDFVLLGQFALLQRLRRTRENSWKESVRLSQIVRKHLQREKFGSVRGPCTDAVKPWLFSYPKETIT